MKDLERMDRAEKDRALRRVLEAAEAMARELRRRELAGDAGAGELCEGFERARDAFSAHAPPPVTSDLRHVAEALQRGWERGSAIPRNATEPGTAGSFLQRWRRRLVTALTASRGSA